MANTMNTIPIPDMPLRYDNGKLFWTERRGGKKIGSEAGTLQSGGYVQIKFKRIIYVAHRIVWVMHHGAIPENYTVDHINRIRTDNHIENLRLAKTMTEQQGNRLGKGFSWNKKAGKFQAYIGVGGVQKHLGMYDKASDARAAYVKAHRKLHGNFSPYNTGK